MEENVTFVVGFQTGIKSKFKALNVLVLIFVFLDKFNLFQVKSVVVGIAQSTEITTKHSDFAKNLQLSATLVSSWACNSISHFWCKRNTDLQCKRKRSRELLRTAPTFVAAELLQAQREEIQQRRVAEKKKHINTFYLACNGLFWFA